MCTSYIRIHGYSWWKGGCSWRGHIDIRWCVHVYDQRSLRRRRAFFARKCLSSALYSTCGGCAYYSASGFADTDSLLYENWAQVMVWSMIWPCDIPITVTYIIRLLTMGFLKDLCLPSTNNRLNKSFFIIILLSLSFFIYGHIPFKSSGIWNEIADYFNGGLSTPTCPQVDALTPQATADLWDSLNAKISTPEFKAKAIKWLSGAVRIP